MATSNSATLRPFSLAEQCHTQQVRGTIKMRITIHEYIWVSFGIYWYLCVSLVSLLCLSCVALVSLLCRSCAALVPLLCRSCVALMSLLCHSCVFLVSFLCLSCVSLVSLLCLSWVSLTEDIWEAKREWLTDWVSDMAVAWDAYASKNHRKKIMKCFQLSNSKKWLKLIAKVSLNFNFKWKLSLHYFHLIQPPNHPPRKVVKILTKFLWSDDDILMLF